MPKTYVPKYRESNAIADDVLAKQIGALLATGATIAEVSRELDLHPSRTKRLSNTEWAKRVMLEIADTAVASAKSRIKARTAGLADDIMDTLSHHLKNKNLNALPIALKVLGFSEQEKTQQAQSLTIVMPGAEPPKTGNAEYVDVTDNDKEKP